MEYKVKINEFEGPLDLPLHLIKEAKVDIWEVKIEEIIEQYLNYIEAMKEMNLDIASSYLVMASELIELKSKLLLPNSKQEENEEEEIDPREALIQRLVEYQKYKDLTKELVRNVGIRTPDWEKVFVIDNDYIEELISRTKLPVVVKVPNSGSSVGVFIVNNKDEFRKALSSNIGTYVIIEEFIKGREIQMAFLGDEALPSIEIISNREFYNYSSKYQKGVALEVTPAGITKEQEIEMGKMLMKVVNTLNLYTYSRADFIIDSEGKIWFIEINSLPGMTQTSLVPQEAQAIGINFVDLCQTIVKYGVNRSVGLDKYISKNT